MSDISRRVHAHHRRAANCLLHDYGLTDFIVVRGVCYEAMCEGVIGARESVYIQIKVLPEKARWVTEVLEKQGVEVAHLGVEDAYALLSLAIRASAP